MTESVDELLSGVVERWRAEGPLTQIIGVIEDVWRKNLDRQEPHLGDDAMSLGILCSRNIMNRCVEQLRDGTPHSVVRGGLTLEVVFDGRVMHLSKVGSQQMSWHPHLMVWDSSEVRIDGARGNAAVYTPIKGTLVEDTPDQTLFGAIGDPADMRNLHLAWQGFPDGAVRAFVGFPTTGPAPWSAVTLVHDGRPAPLGVPVAEAEVAAPSWHDALAEPEVPIRRRAADRQAESAHGSA